MSQSQKQNKYNIDTIIFDLDGTLVDSWEIYISALNYIFSLCGADIKPTSDEIMYFAGQPADIIYTHFLKKEGVYDPSKKEYLKAEYNKKVSDILKTKKDYFPTESSKVISVLKKKGYKLAMGTGAPRKGTNDIVPKSTINLFDEVITIDDVSRPKPDPETFLEASARINTIPENCIVVGDGESDFYAAKSAGMQFILIKNPYNRNFDATLNCDGVIENITELLDIF